MLGRKALDTRHEDTDSQGCERREREGDGIAHNVLANRHADLSPSPERHRGEVGDRPAPLDADGHVPELRRHVTKTIREMEAQLRAAEVRCDDHAQRLVDEDFRDEKAGGVDRCHRVVGLAVQLATQWSAPVGVMADETADGATSSETETRIAAVTTAVVRRLNVEVDILPMPSMKPLRRNTVNSFRPATAFHLLSKQRFVPPS